MSRASAKSIGRTLIIDAMAGTLHSKLRKLVASSPTRWKGGTECGHHHNCVFNWDVEHSIRVLVVSVVALVVFVVVVALYVLFRRTRCMASLQA
jgi:predicted RND superfamily exporter protein